jgi:hypothetical protein
VARGDGHGDAAVTGRRTVKRRAPGKERVEGKEREGVVALEKDSRTSPRPSAASRRWPRLSPAQDTQKLAVPANKTKTILQKTP